MKKPEMPPEVLDFFKKQGRKGGKIGGKITAQKMTTEERSARGEKGAQVRWAKANKKRKTP